MNVVLAYILGLLTVPALAGLVVLYWLVERWLDRRFGITYDVKIRRGVEGIDNYTLRHNIWFERAWGPIFTGHWYRDSDHGYPDAHRRVNRWVGLGPVDGPCVVVYRSVVLGKAD